MSASVSIRVHPWFRRYGSLNLIPEAPGQTDAEPKGRNRDGKGPGCAQVLRANRPVGVAVRREHDNSCELIRRFHNQGSGRCCRDRLGPVKG